MNKDIKKTEKYRRKRSQVKETRRQFLLTFFGKGNKEKYLERSENGFLMVRYFSTERNLFVVNVYSNEESVSFKVWLKKYLKKI